MTVHVFRVLNGPNSPAITQVMQEVAQDPLSARLRTIGNSEMRLEDLMLPGPGNATPYWFMDFTKIRFEHGPGKASRLNPLEGFDLDPEDGFGEETAAMYDPASGYMLIQYNHHGPRAGSICDYLSVYNPGQARAYEFNIKLDETSEAKLAAKEVLTKLHFKIAPIHMTAQQRQLNVSLNRALTVNDSMNGQTIEVIVSAGRGSILGGPIGEIIQSIKALAGADHVGVPSVVETFKVAGRTALGDRSELINMLAPKLEAVIDNVVLGSDLRYTRQSRYSALSRARLGWQAIF